MPVGPLNEFWRASSPWAARAVRFGLRRHGLPAGMRAALWHQAERRVSHYGVREIARTRSGHLLDVDTAHMVEKQIYYFGEWEPHFTRYLLGRAPWPGTFLDLGANIGYFTLLASGAFERVVAVEASPRIFARLAANVARNGVEDRVRCANVAVGAEAAELDFYFDEGQSGGSSLLPGENRVREARVPVLPLDRILSPSELACVSFVKIDVEGLESVVLDQVLGLLGHLRPDLRIMVEYDPARGIDGALERCRAAGFAVALMQGPYALEAYLDPRARAPLAEVTQAPAIFCDLLLERRPPGAARAGEAP